MIVSITLNTLVSFADSHRHDCDIGALARSVKERLVVAGGQTDVQERSR